MGVARYTPGWPPKEAAIHLPHRRHPGEGLSILVTPGLDPGVLFPWPRKDAKVKPWHDEKGAATPRPFAGVTPTGEVAEHIP